MPPRIERTDGPTLLALTRQALPMLNDIPVHTRRAGVLNGGYVAVRETATLSLILIATGSELQHALAAAKILGAGTRVVSMPSMERFDRQPTAYRDSMLPPSCGNASRSKPASRISGTSMSGRRGASLALIASA